MIYRYGRKGIGVQCTPRLFRKYRFVFFGAFRLRRQTTENSSSPRPQRFSAHAIRGGRYGSNDTSGGAFVYRIRQSPHRRKQTHRGFGEVGADPAQKRRERRAEIDNRPPCLCCVYIHKKARTTQTDEQTQNAPALFPLWRQARGLSTCTKQRRGGCVYLLVAFFLPNGKPNVHHLVKNTLPNGNK